MLIIYTSGRMLRKRGSLRLRGLVYRMRSSKQDGRFYHPKRCALKRGF